MLTPVPQSRKPWKSVVLRVQDLEEHLSVKRERGRGGERKRWREREREREFPFP
jgi:hypothetical protein